MKKRLLSLLLCLVMALALVPSVAFGAEVVASGYCGVERDGSNLTWTLDSDGVLTISGTGKMRGYRNTYVDGEYSYMTSAPWGEYAEQVNSVVINDGVTCISFFAFSGCYNMESVAIPDSVIEINNNAFSACLSLEGVTIPDSVTSIGYEAFYACFSLESVKIPNSVTSLGSNAFSDCLCLDNVTIPDSVANLGGGIFKDCISLQNVTLPDNIRILGGSMFYDCISLQNVTLPDGIIGINAYAFCGCSSLTNLTIPDSIEYIQSSAFQDCESLERITIPDGVSRIDLDTFRNCTGLTEVIIGDGVENINFNAFRNCTSLQSVSFGKSINHIEDDVFKGCKNLKDVYYAGSEKQWKKVAIGKYNDPLTSAKMHFALKDSLDTPVVKMTRVSSDSYTGKAKISWSAVTGAAKYEVYRATEKDGEYKLLGTTTKTSYTNSGAPSGTTFYYKVKAITASDKYLDSAFSDIKSFTTTCDVPTIKMSRVSGTTSSGTEYSGKAKLSWDAVTGAGKYEVYRATSKDGEYSLLGTTTKTSYTNSGAANGKTFYYKVKAISADSKYANSGFSAIKEFTTSCAAPVVKMTRVSGTTSSGTKYTGKAKLSWDAVAGASKYEVYRATEKDGEYKLLGTTTKTSYTNSGAPSGTTFYYKVKAISSASKYANSSFSAVKSFTTSCAAPTVTLKRPDGRPKLDWKAVTGAAWYEIYCATSKNGEYILQDITDETSYTDFDARGGGKTYYYKVKAISAESKYANSAYSSVKSITINEYIIPPLPRPEGLLIF